MSIEVSALSYAYGNQKVLNKVSFKAAEGELVSIIGRNGVGKSTLIKCILRLLTDYKGDVLINGASTKSLSIREMATLMAYIPQESSPIFNFSVEDMVLMGTCPTVGYFGSPSAAQREAAQAALSRTGIENLAGRYYHRLSGGEKQLVIIAKALAQGTRILIMDEPTSNLDFGNQIMILERARALCDEGYTVIQCTHNPEHSYMFSDKIIALSEGVVLAEGRPCEVLNCDVVSELYGIELLESRLHGDRARAWVPKSAI